MHDTRLLSIKDLKIQTSFFFFSIAFLVCQMISFEEAKVGTKLLFDSSIPKEKQVKCHC